MLAPFLAFAAHDAILRAKPVQVGGHAGERLRFEERSQAAQLRFHYASGSRGKHDLPEIMGGGVALIDVDADGLLDVFLCNGGPIPPDSGEVDPPCQLFRNGGKGRFEEITDRAGCPGPSYAMGAAVGDYDGDGRDDLFVTGWKDQRLYRNLGGGRFEDATEHAGVTSNGWSTSAAFADLDRDGDLDLYVCQYLDYDAARAPFCAAPDGRRDYCGPEVFPAQPDRLYRNEGNGVFREVGESAGIARRDSRGLGVLIADLVGDHRLDIFVANDGTACSLFENQGDLRFEDVALRSGVALDGSGRALAGMGTALGDLDGDGRSDLVVTNFFGRSTVAFRALGEGLYRDATAEYGLAATTRHVLGFGIVLADLDGDTALDLLQANGHVLDRERLGEPLAMRPLLLRNERGRFRDVSASAGPWFARPALGRGVAVGDLDRDGRPDIVVNTLDSHAALLHNATAGGHRLSIALQGQGQAIGARLRIQVGGRTIVRHLEGGGSYLSASSRILSIGLGPAEQADEVEVAWPSGRSETFGPLAAGWVLLVEGSSPGGPRSD